MDHFAEQRQLKRLDEAEYEAKKRHLMETYSDDGFESDDTDTKDAAAFNPQLSLQDQVESTHQVAMMVVDSEEPLQDTSRFGSQVDNNLQGTSRFGDHSFNNSATVVSNKSDRTFDPLSEFKNAEKLLFKPRSRGQWDADSF